MGIEKIDVSGVGGGARAVDDGMGIEKIDVRGVGGGLTVLFGEGSGGRLVGFYYSWCCRIDCY
jgi:hypothetical protein